MTFCCLQNPSLKIKRSWGPKFPTNPDLSVSCHKAPSSSRCQICRTARLTLIYIKGDLVSVISRLFYILFSGQLLLVSNHKKLLIDFGDTFCSTKIRQLLQWAFADGKFACTSYTGCWWCRDYDVFAGLFYKPHPLKAGLQLHRLFQLKIMLQIKMCQNYHSLEQILLISQMSWCEIFKVCLGFFCLVFAIWMFTVIELKYQCILQVFEW